MPPAAGDIIQQDEAAGWIIGFYEKRTGLHVAHDRAIVADSERSSFGVAQANGSAVVPKCRDTDGFERFAVITDHIASGVDAPGNTRTEY